MGRRDFLLEIGVEELPTSLVREIFAEVEEKFTETLAKFRIPYEGFRVLGTPRRIAISVWGMGEVQEPVVREIKGPAKKVGMDEHGNLLPPALAFARAQGIALEDLFVQETEKGTYIFGRKYEPGKPTQEVLPEALFAFLVSLDFSRSMLWGAGDFRFVRPIRWLVALFGGEEIPLSVAGVSASRLSRGHRFLSPSVIPLPSAGAYEEVLEGAGVIVDPVKRRNRIVERLSQCAQEQGVYWLRDEELLEEVNFLVEYPDVLVGHFSEKYLSLPPKLLITVMKHHQRYFAACDAEGNLKPLFFVVINRPSDGAEKIIRGNERVLRARLEDALFFFEEDKKRGLADRVEDLRGVLFQEDLGSMYEKTERLVELVTYLGEVLKRSEAEIALLRRAAFLSKADLVSSMVREFPELQGYMGRVYALLSGEEEEVALALEESYLPIPETPLGSILSLADKMDTIVSSFALGRIPTGSQDPLGLRRLGQSIVDTLLVREWYCPLSEWIEKNLELLAAQGFAPRIANPKEEVVRFLFGRLRSLLLEGGKHHSVVQAVFATEPDDLYDAARRIEFLHGLFMAEKDFLDAVVTGFTRAYNISRHFERAEVAESLLKEEAERALYRELQGREEGIRAALAQGEYRRAFTLFWEMVPFLGRFFDEVLVMCEDLRLQANRLGLLRRIVNLLAPFANLSLVVLEEGAKGVRA
ncbi:MAG: glycine--tRNA ligase subunit beta [Candidatus Caldatribacterium sp.]|nr:glycine--tRNA ligase subunit beta [Candidatus Caldatribacterium sp.]